jgi:hypothetical protein
MQRAGEVVEEDSRSTQARAMRSINVIETD